MSQTPGPWKWFNYSDGRKALVAPTRAVIHCPDAPMTVDAEDQAIIEAAPDLYKTLKAVVEIYGPWHDDGCPADDTCHCAAKPLHDDINSAIKKAERR